MRAEPRDLFFGHRPHVPGDLRHVRPLILDRVRQRLPVDGIGALVLRLQFVTRFLRCGERGVALRAGQRFVETGIEVVLDRARHALRKRFQKCNRHLGVLAVRIDERHAHLQPSAGGRSPSSASSSGCVPAS